MVNYFCTMSNKPYTHIINNTHDINTHDMPLIRKIKTLY